MAAGEVDRVLRTPVRICVELERRWIVVRMAEVPGEVSIQAVKAVDISTSSLR